MSERRASSGSSEGVPESVAAPPPRARRKAFLTWALIGGALCVSIGALAARRRPPTPPNVVMAPSDPAPVVTPPTPPPTAQAPRPRVELVFALDTTSSMSGLIEGAKRKIWSIASYVAKGQPAPDLRVGLVAFRDLGDDYVTRVYDLDDDLDRVYARLRKLRAEGGGDGPEHVARALDEAVKKVKWSPNKGKDAQGVVRVIYLVGDAPPHEDYDDGYDIGRTTAAAQAAGIAIHTIRCGADEDTARVWRRIASRGQGQFLTIAQDGGMDDATTPYDDELVKLHDRLGGTAMPYGAGAAGMRMAVASAAAAPAPVKVERARFLRAKRKASGGAGDLLDAVEGGVALETVPVADLPHELRPMAPAARAEALATKAKERAAINRRIDELGRERDKFLAKQAAGKRDGFDEVAKAALRETVANTKGAGFSLE